MNPRKRRVNLNHHIFMLYKSVETGHPVSLPCKVTNNSHIYILWGKFLPVGMICTTTDTMGEMYLHARMFCALAHTYSIPMGAIHFYMQEHFLHWLIRLDQFLLR